MLSIIGGILPTILDRILPGDNPENRTKRLELETEIHKAISEQTIAQIKVNEVEAQSSSIFIAGWRPAAAWICVASFAFTAITPLLNYIAILNGLPLLPVFPNEVFDTMLYGLLGLGGLRSIDKFTKNGK